MSIAHPDYSPNGREVAYLMRLERAITRIGAKSGFDGDPLAEQISEPDTHGDIVAACDLLQLLPAKLRNYDRRLAHRMCKAAVYNRSQSEPMLSPPCADTATDVDAKLGRERRRAAS